MTYETTKPTIEKGKGISDDSERLSHPAFGSISVVRTTCNPGVNLFGSKLRHNHVVTLEISTAVLDRDLYSEHHFGGRERVVEIMLSEAQWSRMVASSGIGGGTPCTFLIKPADGYSLMDVPGIEPDEAMAETYQRGVKEKLEELQKGADEVLGEITSLTNSGKANKTQLAALHRKMENYFKYFAANMGYAQETMAEAMEKTVADGKTEIEAFVNNMAVQTGIEALRNGGVVRMIESDEDRGDGGSIFGHAHP